MTRINTGRNLVRRGNKYTVYPNGDVYEGDKFKLSITEENHLSYIQNRSWSGISFKIHLDSLVDGYPDSFNFLTELRDMVQEHAPEAVQDIRNEVKDKMARTAKLMELPLEDRVKELLEVSRNGNLWDYYNFKQARWVTIMEVLDQLLTKKKRTKRVKA